MSADSKKENPSEQEEERIKRLNKVIYRTFFKSILVIVVPLVISLFVGDFLDKEFDIKPYGTVFSNLASIVITWSLLVYMLLKDGKSKK